MASRLTVGKKLNSAGPVVPPSLSAPAPHFSKRKVLLTMTANKRTMNDPLPLTHLNAKTKLSGPMFKNVARLLDDRHVAVVHGGGKCKC